MTAFLSEQQKVLRWISDLSKDEKVFFPQKKGKKNYQWLPVNEESTLSFDGYIPTLTPAGKLILPADSELFTFRKEETNFSLDAVIDDTPQIIAGIRPCDVKSIMLLDKAMLDDVDDPQYSTKRKATTLIMYRCDKGCDDKAFCQTAGSLSEVRGADIVLTQSGKNILIEVQTDKGKDLVQKGDFEAVEDTQEVFAGYEKAITKKIGRQLKASVSDLPEIMKKTWDSDLWQKYSDKCFSCGSCNLICPTCYCFGTRDDINLDCVSGNRTRCSDSCMLSGFAQVAGDHNFRGKVEIRQRHRVHRKFDYLPEKYKEGSFCVGCGRCGRQCTADIDIFDIANEITIEGGKA
jgi:formate hydrogenlyase subunit 6/NADH:ubiquinone oxidoreductase subunit I